MKLGFEWLHNQSALAGFYEVFMKYHWNYVQEILKKPDRPYNIKRSPSLLEKYIGTSEQITALYHYTKSNSSAAAIVEFRSV